MYAMVFLAPREPPRRVEKLLILVFCHDIIKPKNTVYRNLLFVHNRVKIASRLARSPVMSLKVDDADVVQSDPIHEL